MELFEQPEFAIVKSAGKTPAFFYLG